MLTILGWSVATLLGLFLLVIQWSWRKHAVESLAQSEFISVIFMDRGIYESNRKVYIDWLDGLPRDITIGHVHAASQGAQNIATSYIGKLGLTAGLFAVLAKYKSTHPCDLAG